MAKALLTLTLVVALASCAHTRRPAPAADTDVLALFEYERAQPLDVVADPPVRSEDKVVQRFTFMSVNGERVTALLVKPLEPTKPCPVVIYQHGRGSNKERARRSPLTAECLKKGWAVAAIDAYNHGERGKEPEAEVPSGTKRINLSVQTTIDHRRLIDYLETRDDLDASRIAYVGVSMGAMIGSATCGIDKRIGAAVFIVGGGSWTLEQFMSRRGGLDKLTPELKAEFEEEKKTDPAVFAGMISPRPLLMVNGTEDSAIPRENAEALFAAAREPKTIVWKEAGHGGAGLAIPEEMAFLTGFFGE